MQVKILLSALIFGVGFSGAALAEDSPWYVGMQLGQMRVGVVDSVDFGNTDAVAATFGYKLNNSFAIEGAITTTGTDGDVTFQGVQGTWNLTTSALYAAYRSSGDVYFKGKIGYLHERVNSSIVGTSFSGSDSGGSYGIGAGWRPGDKLTLELEYTRIDKDANFVSLGVNFGY